MTFVNIRKKPQCDNQLQAQNGTLRQSVWDTPSCSYSEESPLQAKLITQDMTQWRSRTQLSTACFVVWSKWKCFKCLTSIILKKINKYPHTHTKNRCPTPDDITTQNTVSWTVRQWHKHEHWIQLRHGHLAEPDMQYWEDTLLQNWCLCTLEHEKIHSNEHVTAVEWTEWTHEHPPLTFYHNDLIINANMDQDQTDIEEPWESKSN